MTFSSDFLGHQAADADIVEGDVKRVRILDEHVIGDHLHAGIGGGLEGRQDGIGIVGDNENDVDLLSDQAFDVGELLGGGKLGVGRDVFVAGGLDDFLDRRFVDFPALFLEGFPGDGDGLARGHGGER